MNPAEETHDPARCPRCGTVRICNMDHIHACPCTTVDLTEPQRRYIGSLFNGCLCTTCLRELKTEFYLIAS